MSKIACRLGNLVKSLQYFSDQRRNSDLKRKHYSKEKMKSIKIKEAGAFLDRCKIDVGEIQDFVYERGRENLVTKIPQRRKNAICERSEEERLGLKILLKKHIRTKRFEEFGIIWRI